MMGKIGKVFLSICCSSFIVSCASNNDVKDIKNMLIKNKDEFSQINSRIDQVNNEIDEDEKRLESLESKGKGFSDEATKLKNDIDKKKVILYHLEKEIGFIKKIVDSNTNEIEKIKKDQGDTKIAIRDALDKNNEIKIETHNGIEDIENKYQEARNKRRDEEQEN